MQLKLWPWDNEGEKPFFTSEGYEWWIEREFMRDNLPDIIPFIVRDINTGKPEERVLMDRKTNDVIWAGTGLEEMCCYMDMIHLKNTLK